VNQPIGIQRRFMELGRIRLGEKGPKGEPRKLTTFRLTSAQERLLLTAAELYGGKVEPWTDAPNEGYFELYTETAELDIVLPPAFSAIDGTLAPPYSQYYELWSGGGCQRRCDGVTELLTAEPCMCNPDERACEITTRVNVMLPRVAGLGVFLVTSNGWNAAAELPGTLELLQLAAQGKRFIPGVLRIEQRSAKRPGRPVQRYVVPVIDLPGVTLASELERAGQPLGVAAPPFTGKPALPTGVPAPEDPAFENDKPEEAPQFGPPPDLPKRGLERLREVAMELGFVEETERAIENARNKYGEGTEFFAWIGRQIDAAEERLGKVGKGRVWT
jgi:Recombination directionality factor-like